ncbi:MULTISPECIES: 3-deoxy-7-phosphoheptulonate synthase [unclassified Saccharopolyspora]|uniref:3-deoxy-7-phosphoheptulonate synthase n=1 Tax=unclassified Saccharopolyspora TaxID=2646250 RepID=UPI001CD7874B|nr:MULTISPECIES: 3-deoxy-7-phosphoheptulonate synthase [unclassified Saccharopolyspora]MCA1187638.1 3-deoxy-7-phosphoheptulonate synthase [Saccharopolyspora sp. 6T]MCA1278853.1 3-deoxy-7-phosphoheptulonate synthase [Saccharopolyspora sp. 7B]
MSEHPSIDVVPMSGGSVVAVTSPAALSAELPVDQAATSKIADWRRSIAEVLAGEDDRVLAVVGPCSLHDAAATRQYASRLRGLAAELSDEIFVVMRAYLEKPRTTVGWTGLLADPGLDGSADIETGLRTSRRLLLELADLDLPTATEWVSPIAPDYLGDLISYGAIGARTVESQVHRQLTSALPMPIGMKNGTSGSLQAAVDAIVAARHPHSFLASGADGAVTWVRSTGNPAAHIILRGGATGPNYDATSVRKAVGKLRSAGVPPAVVVDASHGNSGKDHTRQPSVVAAVGDQIASGTAAIRGVMVESFLVPGRQDIGAARPLRFGQSITDACLGWDDTAAVLRDLAASVRASRRTCDSANWLQLA